ncbi:uncharacterized protein JN550_010366 [Neoarthrinium moseri]|nr:uncharacterized protein JN550_010366 [Neoarthrinium moseri]KAI1862210.1 hypothetical protein JN550_010366 [Neoarthrinium moseri]
MAAASHSAHSATPAPLASHPTTNGADHYHHQHAHHDHRPAPTPASVAAANKKNKNKKAMDSSEASKLVAARISQLEVDNAAEKEQQEEIDREVKKHNRELAHTTTKMNDMDKIDHLTKKCSELFASMKRLERESAKNKKRADQVQKEKDASRNEASKQTGLKEKLEKLCRELQRDNNKLKNDHRSLQDAHSKLRKDSDRRFEEAFKTLEGWQEEKDNPRKQVVNAKVEDLMRARFKSLIDQYELRELHFHSHMRTKELEVQYHMARFEEQKKSAEAESSKSRQLNNQILTFHKTETELRTQLNVYVEKFRQVSPRDSSQLQALGLTCASLRKVEDTLNNSNDLFLTFRKEMEDMSKKTKTLEKENEKLKRKKEILESNIAKMAQDWDKDKKSLAEKDSKGIMMRKIINQMQKQGRTMPQGMQADADADVGDDGELEEESAYEDDYGEGDEGSDFDDETEEEVHESAPAPRPMPYGPEPPPSRTAQKQPITSTAPVAQATNGHI